MPNYKTWTATSERTGELGFRIKTLIANAQLYQISAEHEGAKLGALLRIVAAASDRAHTNHIHANRGAFLRI